MQPDASTPFRCGGVAGGVLEVAMRWVCSLVGWGCLVCLGASGCSAGEESAGRGTLGTGDPLGGTGAVAGTGGALGAGGFGQQAGTGGVVGQGGAGTQGTGGMSGCAAASSEAEAELLPTDVVWAIDSSGSMLASFPAIQQALNTFSQRVTDAGIDAHIILLAGADSGLCVPPPLGSGQCGPALMPGGAAPDSREPQLLHLDLPFGWNEGMGTLLDNHERYEHLLRPNALTHLVLTEDGVPPVTAAQVVDHVEGRAGATLGAAWSPGLAPGGWVFHGVVCKDGVGMGVCALSALVGPPVTTLDLITQTGGQLSNLDDAGNGSGVDPFAQLLDKLAEQVIVGARVSCDYAIPPPPSGETLDQNAVNVVMVDGGGASTLFPRIPDGMDCGDNTGWQYDDPASPTRVVLCPAACDAAQSDAGARVDVQFGCETVVLQ